MFTKRCYFARLTFVRPARSIVAFWNGDLLGWKPSLSRNLKKTPVNRHGPGEPLESEALSQQGMREPSLRYPALLDAEGSHIDNVIARRFGCSLVSLSETPVVLPSGPPNLSQHVPTMARSGRCCSVGATVDALLDH